MVHRQPSPERPTSSSPSRPTDETLGSTDDTPWKTQPIETQQAVRQRAQLLDQLLEPDVDLDQAFDRLLGSPDDSPDGSPDSRPETPPPARAVVPGDALASADITLAVLLASVLREYEDIDRLLDNLREHESAQIPIATDAHGARRGSPPRVVVNEAVVSEAELADPEALSRALAPFESDRERFEALFDSAMSTLDHLDVYELSRLPSEELVRHMRVDQNLRTVQSLVGFLRTLRSAAETFEAMAMPEPHIRDYLTHLYCMRDWNEMARLVSVLELAVSQLHDADLGVPSQEAT